MESTLKLVVSLAAPLIPLKLSDSRSSGNNNLSSAGPYLMQYLPSLSDFNVNYIFFALTEREYPWGAEFQKKRMNIWQVTAWSNCHLQ